MKNEKKKKTSSKPNWLMIIGITLVLVVVVIFGFLVMMGPVVGNVFSDIVQGLDGGSSNYLYAEQQSLPMAMADSSSELAQRSAQLPNTGGGVANTASMGTAAPQTEGERDDGVVNEEPKDMFFDDYGVNPFMETSQDHLSTFAMDVDTASYTLTRSYLMDYKQVPDPAAVRSEEFINYYPMNYAPPTDGSAFAIHIDAAPSPFTETGQILLRVGVQGRMIESADRDPALLIFVIDVSGSMSDTNRLGLAKQSLEILVDELREDDRVAIVVYSDATRVVLEPTPASEKERILSAIHALQTEGSTNAEAGLRLGYDVALAHMKEGETTRVILASDGVANVGNTGPDAILNTIRQGMDEGITLSTIGFGMGNYNDVLMEQLANDGNGNYFYVDNLREARRIFSYNLTSTLQVIGYDAKIQVDFNPEVVTRYRLIGYENRDIADVDFRNDTVDAGEVGAGHTIMALYEVEILDGMQSGVIATARLRFEDAETRQVVEMSQAFDVAQVLPEFALASEDFRMVASLAEFSEILRHSPFGDSSLSDILVVLDSMARTNANAEEIGMLIRAAINHSEQ
jgi:Ca-activated chloride channel family protein